MEKQQFSSVFTALCDTPQEAANLRLRAELMQHIAGHIQAQGWTQAQAATMCGITQPRMNDLLQGKIDKFSLDALVNIQAHIGQPVSLRFEPA